MIWTQDHQVRHVLLNQNHSAHPKPSWFGESVGHYEGDSLVVDTIGVDTRTFVDNYFTPHTDQLHVIERYRLTDERKDAAGGPPYRRSRRLYHPMDSTTALPPRDSGPDARNRVCGEQWRSFQPWTRPDPVRQIVGFLKK